MTSGKERQQTSNQYQNSNNSKGFTCNYFNTSTTSIFINSVRTGFPRPIILHSTSYMKTGRDNHKVSDVAEGLNESNLNKGLSRVLAPINRQSKTSRYVTGGVAIAIIIGMCIAVVIFSSELARMKEYGYLGVFIICIFAGGTVIVPVPGLLVVFTLGSILHPLIVGIVAGLGEAIGVITIYIAGSTGQGMLEKINNRFIIRFTEWIHRYKLLAVFLMSAVINPFYYPFALMAGMLRLRLPDFFLSCWAGKAVKNTGIAYLGFFGFGSLLDWLGVLE